MKNLAVVVLSCDKYSDLWDLFFDRWERFWPDCPYDLYLISNKLEYNRENVNILKTEEDIDWSTNLLIILEKIIQDNVLLMIEDAPLNKIVETKEFNKLYEKFCKEKLNYLNLKSSPCPNGKKNEEMGELIKGSLYRAALVPCIWNKEVLKLLTLKGESAWDFEILGTERSDIFPRFFSLNKPFFQLLHCVVQGKIDRRAHRHLKKTKEILKVNFPTMTYNEYITLRFREICSYIFTIIIPSKYQRKIRTSTIRYLKKLK